MKPDIEGLLGESASLLGLFVREFGRDEFCGCSKCIARRQLLSAAALMCHRTIAAGVPLAPTQQVVLFEQREGQA